LTFHDPKTGKKGKRIPELKKIKNSKNDGNPNFEYRTLTVSQRVIDIINKLKEFTASDNIITQLRKNNKTDDLLFTGKDGKLAMREYYDSIYESLLKKHNASYSQYPLYSLRHTACTRLLRQKEDLKTVQMIMGDNSPEMVLRVYANMNKDDMERGSKEYSENMDLTLSGEI